MINFPDQKTRDAVELYHILCRAAAIVSLMDDGVLQAVSHWVTRHSGAEPFEMEALQGLINGNLDVQDR